MSMSFEFLFQTIDGLREEVIVTVGQSETLRHAGDDVVADKQG